MLGEKISGLIVWRSNHLRQTYSFSKQCFMFYSIQEGGGVESVYETYMKDIVRSEYRSFYTTSTLNLNKHNRKTEVMID